MKYFKIIFAAAALLFVVPAAAQFPATVDSTPRIGQSMLQRASDCSQPGSCSADGSPKVALVQAAAPAEKSGGVIQLSAFGWLQPYVDTIVQALIVAFFGIIGKSKYTQWLDQSSRDALQTFVQNRASSLIADGAVRLQSKSVKVDNLLLYRAANEASTAIPDAMKRFGLTPDVLATKIIDAIPQTSAGAAIIAAAHAETPEKPVPVTDRPSIDPKTATPNNPPVSGEA